MRIKVWEPLLGIEFGCNGKIYNIQRTPVMGIELSGRYYRRCRIYKEPRDGDRIWIV